MDFKVCLAKKLIIFYSILGAVISYASAHNLIYGLILHQTSSVRIGAFSLFGFIIFPVLLIATYVRNKATFTSTGVRIFKTDYNFSEYNFKIIEREIPFKDRPIISLLKKNYHEIRINKKGSRNIVFEKDLDVFNSDLKKIREALSVIQ